MRWLPLLALLAGCAEVVVPDYDYDILGDADTEPDPICEEEFSLCGDILLPHPVDGEPRMMAVALYRRIPPAGPPFATLIEDEGGDMPWGGRYKVRLNPVLEAGDFYVWSNLYMEGGGQFIPENGTDFVGNAPDPLTFGDGPVDFGEFQLTLATGW
jgi:hypothetical protein